MNRIRDLLTDRIGGFLGGQVLGWQADGVGILSHVLATRPASRAS